jgi:ABC-type nitrate/sulfonate/bicarbonate transport system permease component
MPSEQTLTAAAARRPIAFRGGGFTLRPRRWASWIAFAAVLAAWQGAVGSRLVDPVFLPSPLSILLALQHLVATGELWRHLAASFSRIGAGWAIGTIAGLGAGLAMGLFSPARAVGVPVISALFPIPKIALLPLLILWLGIGETPKITTIALGVFFPTAIATVSGIDGVSLSLVRMGQSFGLPFGDVVRKIVLPGALPSILAGFRISTATALLLVVAAEMIGAERGIGAFVTTTGNLMQTDQLMAGVVVLSILGLLIGALLSALERWLLRWR